MLDYSLIDESPPELEPVAIGEARRHVALDHDCDDGLLGALITAARQKIEKETRSRLLSREVELRVPASVRLPLDLPIGPVQRVLSAAGLVNGQSTPTPAPELTAPGQLAGRLYWPANALSWPTMDATPGAWRIRLEVGYGSEPSQVPAALRQAILLLVGHWYEQREGVVVGTIASDMPQSIESLVSLWAVPGTF